MEHQNHLRIYKEQEILKDKGIDVRAIRETKKKGEGQKEYGNCILVYSDLERDQRAESGVRIRLKRLIKPTQILEVKNLNSANVKNDHILELGK